MANGVELATAYVSLTVSASKIAPEVNKQFGAVERSAGDAGKRAGGKFTSGVSGAAKGIAGALAGAFIVKGAADFFKSTITAASDLQQSVGGVEAVFGKMSKSISDSAKGAAQNLGLTENAYNQLATVLGAGLKNQGLKDYTKSTQTLIKTGADLAAQFGGSTQDAVDALASAMRGESDPIERYGISLSETAVNAELARKGQAKLTGAALTTAKAQARIALITKQSSSALGTFAKEGDTLAGKQQRLSASFGNLKTSIGTALLPIVTKATEGLAGFVDGMKTGAGVGGAFVKGIKGIWTAVQPVGKFLIGTLVPAIAAVVKILTTGNFDGGIRKALGGLEEDSGLVTAILNIRDAVGSAVGFVKRFVPAIAAIVKLFATGNFNGGIRKALGMEESSGLVTAIFKIRDAFGSAVGFVKGFIDEIRQGKGVGGEFRTIFEGIAKVVVGFVKGFQDGTGAGGAFRDVLSTVVTVAKDVWTWIDKNSTIVGSLAVALGAGALAWGAIALATTAYEAVLGIATAAQAAFNLVMDANPIGIVIVAIAALAAGLIYAYKHSETFRLVVDTAFAAVAAAARWLWNNVLQPVIKFIVNGFGDVVAAIAAMLRALSNIPGFEWAKTAAKNMQAAADMAHKLADQINDIPEHTDVKIYTKFVNDHIDVFRVVNEARGDNVRSALRDLHGFASGTPSAPAGLAWVGERGPELVDFRGGERVLNTKDSMGSSVQNDFSINGVTVIPRDFNDFMRQMDEKQRMAALGPAKASR